MPRGGGGGFRGGGFGGGGFRGGGFRGGGRSFRVGRVRSSGRPFGRTGARRTVSRSPRGSYHRRHHRRHWGPYYRPWYRRWWHWHWWWGYPYRPWYYAPVYWGGGILLFILALLVILPIIGLAFIPFPFTSASSDGVITYRDTQTLYYNEYWYEREHMTTGQTIEFNMQAIGDPSSEVTFLIWDQPFESFPETRTLTGSYSESMTVEGNHDYQYLGYFLKPGSILNYEFNVTSGGPIEFFIADANDLNRWNNWETISPPQSFEGSAGSSYTNTFNVLDAQDWYLVWYNSGSSSVGIDFSVDYTAVNMFDFSQADVVYEGVEEVPTDSLTVPREGDWYFFVYFDPFINPSESVDITFDISYNTDITHERRWTDFTPILLVIGSLIVIVLLVAIVQRRSSKKQPVTTTPSGAAVTPTTTTPAPTTAGECHRCKFSYKPGQTYCTNCGAKLVGRDYGVAKITTPAAAKNCASCGSALKPDSRYCKTCGAKVEQETKPYKYFPDERKSFFCQLDNEKHPSTDSAYQCVQCSRMVCNNCYEDISKTGITACPYCKGELIKAQ